MKILKKLIIILTIPTIFISQYYLFKLGILSPQIKGVQVSAIKGKYLKDIDKYVIKINETVVFSAGNYVKFPSYAKEPIIEFKNLDKYNKVQIQKSANKTVKITGKKEGLSSVAIVKGNKIIKKFNILVVNPKILNLNTQIQGKLKYVGDIATIKNVVEVDFDRFNEKYNVNYESTNEKVLKIKDNKIYAIGVGKASIIASLDQTSDVFNYNISVKLKSIKVDKVCLKVGEEKYINAKVVTSPKNLKAPKLKYNFAKNKLPIQRNIALYDDGKIIGLRKGKEKILISCGSGQNKIKKYIDIVVIEHNS